MSTKTTSKPPEWTTQVAGLIVRLFDKHPHHLTYRDEVAAIIAAEAPDVRELVEAAEWFVNPPRNLQLGRERGSPQPPRIRIEEVEDEMSRPIMPSERPMFLHAETCEQELSRDVIVFRKAAELIGDGPLSKVLLQRAEQIEGFLKLSLSFSWKEHKK